MNRGCYAVLAQVSLSYSPPKGKLPTCYSPVRRYTREPKSPFPLDLHVLGTPPALILSQDQTLELNCFRARTTEEIPSNPHPNLENLKAPDDASRLSILEKLARLGLALPSFQRTDFPVWGN